MRTNGPNRDQTGSGHIDSHLWESLHHQLVIGRAPLQTTTERRDFVSREAPQELADTLRKWKQTFFCKTVGVVRTISQERSPEEEKKQNQKTLKGFDFKKKDWCILLEQLWEILKNRNQNERCSSSSLVSPCWSQLMWTNQWLSHGRFI